MLKRNWKICIYATIMSVVSVGILYLLAKAGVNSWASLIILHTALVCVTVTFAEKTWKKGTKKSHS